MVLPMFEKSGNSFSIRILAGLSRSKLPIPVLLLNLIHAYHCMWTKNDHLLPCVLQITKVNGCCVKEGHWTFSQSQNLPEFAIAQLSELFLWRLMTNLVGYVLPIIRKCCKYYLLSRTILFSGMISQTNLIDHILDFHFTKYKSCCPVVLSLRPLSWEKWVGNGCLLNVDDRVIIPVKLLWGCA